MRSGVGGDRGLWVFGLAILLLEVNGFIMGWGSQLHSVEDQRFGSLRLALCKQSPALAVYNTYHIRIKSLMASIHTHMYRTRISSTIAIATNVHTYVLIYTQNELCSIAAD